MLSAYASGTLILGLGDAGRAHCNFARSTAVRIRCLKRGSAPSPLQNVAGAASEAISLGLGLVDRPLRREPVRADRLELDSPQNVGSVRCPPREALQWTFDHQSLRCLAQIRASWSSTMIPTFALRSAGCYGPSA